MKNKLHLSDKEITEIYNRHVDTVYRVCFAYMKNIADTEDALQETFIKLIKSEPEFQSIEHEKAWLIRTAGNTCKNILRHWWRKRENIENYSNLHGNSGIKTDDLLNQIMQLPDKYKIVIYMYYYEGYSSVEIADILRKPKSTIRNYLHEARLILKERLGEYFYEE